MAAPFTGEDIVKRGIFSALIGLKQKSGPQKSVLPTPPTSNPWQEFDEQQPCSTWRLRQHDQQQVQQPLHQASNSPAGQRSLSQQLENTFLASPEQQQKVVVTSPHDIFQEIMCECAPMEHMQLMEQQRLGQQGQTFPSPNADPWFASATTDFEMNSIVADPQAQFISQQPPNHFQNQPSDTQHSNIVDDPLVCPNCFHSVELVRLSALQQQGVQIDGQQRREALTHTNYTPAAHQWTQHPYIPAPQIAQVTPHSPVIQESQLKGMFSSGNLSIEEFVKMIASTIKDSGLLKHSDKPVSPASGMETPEEILKRKRQQNNEAAARYRRRQKEAKLTKNDEVEQLSERNRELRYQIDEIQGEMRRIRGMLQSQNRK